MNLFDKQNTEIENSIKTNNTIIIPWGSIEKHNYLPSSTDFIIADSISKEISDKLKVPRTPTILIGLSLHPHNNFGGTISFHADTLIKAISDLNETDAKNCGLKSAEELIREIKKSIKINLTSITFLDVTFLEGDSHEG